MLHMLDTDIASYVIKDYDGLHVQKKLAALNRVKLCLRAYRRASCSSA